MFMLLLYHDEVIGRVHPGHLMNVEKRQATADPQLALWVCLYMQLSYSSTSTITVGCQYYWAKKLILVLPCHVR